MAQLKISMEKKDLNSIAESAYSINRIAEVVQWGVKQGREKFHPDDINYYSY